MLLRDLDGEAGALDHFGCSLCGLGEQVVIKSVRPENDLVMLAAKSRPVFTGSSFVEPSAKCLRGKFGDLALKRHACGQFRQMAEARRLRDQVRQSGPK